MVRVLVGMVTVAAVFAASGAAADRIELKDGAMTLSAPAAVNCAEPPDFTLEGGGQALFAMNRAALNTLVAQMAEGLAASCDTLDRVTVRGEERGVSFSFEVTRAGGWRLDPASDAAEPAATPAVAVPAPATPPASATVAAPPAAQPAAAPQQTATSQPAPAPARPVRPEIEPGLEFSTFVSMFGSMPSLRGHVSFSNSDVWTRVMAARLYAANPQILQNDDLAIDLLGQMATGPEYAQILGPLAGKRMRDISVFERRDLAERIRREVKPGLDQRRQTGAIPVYHSVPLRLGEFDFATSSFALDNVERLRQHQAVGWNNIRLRNAFDNVVLPRRLRVTQDQARQLDTFLRARGDMTVHLAVFAEIDPRAPRGVTASDGNQWFSARATVTQVALFADQSLAQLLYDFTAELAPLQAEVDRATVELHAPLAWAEDIVAAIDTLNGNSGARTAVTNAYIQWQASNRGRPLSVTQPEAERALALGAPGAAVRLAGHVDIGGFDPINNVASAGRVSIGQVRFRNLSFQNRIQVDLARIISQLPIGSEKAAQFGQWLREGHRSFEIRVEGDLVQGSIYNETAQAATGTAIVNPTRLIVFDPQSARTGSPQTILVDYTVPESEGVATLPVPSLMEGLRPAE
ncbi:MAG: hypothetical protein QNJ13_08440 [Paracoccaceae bacterium]|nr:hypothetical protein [Paracoccaceae bacterium]